MARTARRRLGLPLLPLAAFLLLARSCFVGLGPKLEPQRLRPSRRAEEQEDTTLTDFWIEDVSPVGRKVIEVYRLLQSVKTESEVAEVMKQLDANQKKMLSSILTARKNPDRPIESPEPENGDSPQRLYQKLRMLKDDDEVVRWRARVDAQMLQLVIEKEQMKLADAEKAKEGELDDNAEAQEAWTLFQAQFPKAAEREVYMTTPCREADVKYRFRRLKETMEVSSETALQILSRDCTPMFVDPDFIRRTWSEMVKVTGYDDALESIVLKHPGSLVTQPQNVKAKINEIKTGAAVIGAFSDIGRGFAGLFAGGAAAAAGKVARDAFRRRKRRALRSRTALRATNPDLTEDMDEPPFELRGFSLAQAFLVLGTVLIVVSFGDYFVFGTGGGGGIGGLTFIYAVPVLLLGAALLYAELLPVEVETEPGAEGLFEAKATKTIRKVKDDVTRHRYGDDAHLDSSLKALGLVGTGGRFPKLLKIIEAKAPNGELAFRMLFESKDLPFTIWNDPMKIVACDRFFGPGIWTEISKYDAGQRIAELKLTTGAKPGES
ncbi:unnamed protein product [Effrenium voratum]|uniref:Transmembrane protein n=1 Tax=Effrenium voratum TaxID=2562239 RepID=A0AA36NE50_9DINO|nr:unnamed protein product [Effrenium voratum]